MAIKDCEKISNIVATGLIAGDDELSQEIARLTKIKRDALARSRNLKTDEAIDLVSGQTAHSLELRAASIDVELRAITQAKILKGELNVAGAYEELARQIKKTKGNIAGGLDLLEKVRSATPADYGEIARLWDDTLTATEAMADIQNAIANSVAANYSIRQYSEFVNDGVASIKRQLRDGKITVDQAEKDLASLHSEAMRSIDEGKNPAGFVKLDEEWQAIKKIAGDDKEEQKKMWGQYVLAREMLADGGVDDEVLKIFKRTTAPANLTGDLTLDQISKYQYKDLDKLLARAYTNTKQLYEDGILRDAYRQKLVELTSGMNISGEKYSRVASIVNTLNFAEQGATFSDVLMRNKLYESAKRRGLDVSKTDGTKLFNGLKTFAKAMSDDPQGIPNIIEIGGVEMKPIDVAQLIYDITGDKNIVKLINIGEFDDNTILDIATQYLLGDNKAASKKIIALFSKAKELTEVTNSRNLIFKTITGNEIKEGAPMRFFNFREGLYIQDELNRGRAALFDAIADKNKMNIPVDDIIDITKDGHSLETLEQSLEGCRGGYLVTNDVERKSNEILRTAINEMNRGLTEDSDRFIHVIFPNRVMSASLIMEGDKLYFKTVDDALFNDIAGTISIQTLGEARPTRDMSKWIKEIATGTDEFGNNVDELAALEKYNDAINDAAIKYYGELLGVSGEKVDGLYIDAVKNKVSELAGIDIRAFDEIKDKSKLWQKIDKKLSIAKVQAGKYDRVLVDIAAEIRRVGEMSEGELASSIKVELGDFVEIDKIVGNESLAHIREAYTDYKIATSAVDSLMAKGKIVSLVNGGTAQNMSIDEIKNMFKNKNFYNIYKDMFFPNQEMNKKELVKFIDGINDSIFNSLTVQLAENIVSAGYSLPLVNIKELVYDYLTDNLDLNSGFVEAFFFKNSITPTSDNLHSLLDIFMPKEIKFGYEDALYRGFNFSESSGERAVIREVDNQFLLDSYSALASIEMVKEGEVPSGYERKILDSILTKYYNAFADGLKGGLTFTKAQQIKQEASYALDMFEQDFLIPRYGRFLSTQERHALLGMKYSLPIAVTGQNVKTALKEILDKKEMLLKRYDSTLKKVADDNQINMAIVGKLKSTDARLSKQIEERKNLLIEKGGVIKEVGGEYLVYDSRKALKEVLETLPKNISGVESLKSLGSDGINELTNKQVYTLLRYIEAAKALNATANYATELMYRQNPILAKYAFFTTFKVVDGLPRALKQNSLLVNKTVGALDNSSVIDETIKKGIFGNIISQFNKNGYIEMATLKKIIQKNVDEHIDELVGPLHISTGERRSIAENMRLIYQNAFTPYTYLRDIPSGGKMLNGETLPDIKKKVSDIMKQQYSQAMADLNSLGYKDLDGVQDMISITLDDGSIKTLRELSSVDIDSRKQDIFGQKNTFVEAADLIRAYDIDPEKHLTEYQKNKIIAKEKEFRENIINSYNSTFQSMMNQTQIISESERNLMTSFMRDVRTSLKKYSLTNMLSDTADALSGINEEAARGIKDYLIGFKGQISFGKVGKNQIMDRYKLVKEAYEQYYQLDVDGVAKIRPTNQAEDLALKIAKYFKTLERRLGSADGLTGCTTKQGINRAFYHIGETFMNLKDTDGVFGMLSAIEQNQFLKFFKFSNNGQLSYVPEFVRRGARVSGGLGGYRDYVTDVSGITQKEFNEIFGTSFGEGEFKRVLQGLSGFTITGPRGRKAQEILNFLNGSNMIARLLMSYPGQLLTIPQQSVAYFLKQKWFEREIGQETLSAIDEVRGGYGILDGAYNEINLRNKSMVSPDDTNSSSFYNRYGVPDVDKIYQNVAIETTDDYLDMYAKIDDYASRDLKKLSRWQRQLDPYKDNANNIIDGLFARNFKNIAFIKALKQNDFMQFSSAKAFKDFMEDGAISATVKQRAMDSISSYSGRNFRNILGLGFGGLERPVAGGGFGNIMYGLMQLMNFRGARGQNIFKQTGTNIKTMLKMAFSGDMLSAEGKDAVARYVATQPEFMNFIGAVFNDVMWTWKLQRFQDNGQRSGEEEYDMMDFISYFTDTLNMTSQRWQGLQSFGPFRPIQERGESVLAHQLNPTVYKDEFGVGALFNAIWKNVGRQRKPYNWIAKAIAAGTTDGWGGFEAYVQNKFWELSFGSLRYMVNEDSNSYGYTYELQGQVGGIPNILMGEAPLNADKNFSYELNNNETRETMQAFADGNLSRDNRWTYLGNLAKTIVNGSQLFSLSKNVKRAINRNAPSYWTADDLADIFQKTEYGKEFYDKGYVTPRTPEDAKVFFDSILANGKYRPGSSSFNKSIMQYDQTGHMNGNETGAADDVEMELRLEHMKYLTNDHGEIISDNKGKVEDPLWRTFMKDIESHYYDQTYVSNVVYAYAKNWLNEHPTDPNYQLYIKMLGQGQAVNLIEQQLDRTVEYLNAYAGKGADNKWTETELKNSGIYKKMLLDLGNSILPGDNKIFFNKLQVLDTDATSVAALLLIKSQIKEGGDIKTLDRFFSVSEKSDGTIVAKLKGQYESILTQIGHMSRALSDGNIERFVAGAASVVHQFKDDDPTGIVTASMIDSIYSRLYESNTISDAQKLEAMAELFHDNKEFIQRNPQEMRRLLGDDYDIYADYMNQMIYQWDGEVISTLESVQSSGDRGSASRASGTASKLSSAFKNLMLSNGGDKYSSSHYGNTSSGKQRVPIKISGSSLVRELGVRGYAPVDVEVDFKAYKPHLNLSIGKDINRKVKTTKTQQVSTEKQLSNAEKKTAKAIEAES